MKRRSVEAEARIENLKRFGACLAGGFVLALMVGTQEGTQQDFGYAFRQSVAMPRILIFLGIGVLLYLAITFGPRAKPYLTRPGLRPLGAGVLTVIISLTLLKWTDSPQINTGKFRPLADAAAPTQALDSLARLWFGSAFSQTAWLLLIIVTVLAAAGMIRRSAPLSYAAAILAGVLGIWAEYASAAVSKFLHYPSHATGGAVAMLGFFTIAVASLVSARSQAAEADTDGFIDRVLGWRPGLALVVLGFAVGLVGVFNAAWFSPGDRNATLSTTASMFGATNLNGFAQTYLDWLGFVLFFVTLVVAGVASYLRHRLLAYAAIVLGLVSTLLTLVVVHDFSALGGKQGFDGAQGAWDNLGTGAWMTCAALSLFAGAGYLVLKDLRIEAKGVRAGSDIVGSGTAGARGQVAAATMLVVIIAALFYPPTATEFWQTVLVSEIGIYVLLAIGLNVVVGWAGLLDLGFIAFYAIGSYTTAYFTGRLPVQPPDWLLLSPLACIPFAIAACLIAGVALGFPTLRLRGDYLAIVTLGFGEIIRVIANNANGFTNGPRGAFNIPAPQIHLGPIHLTWGDSALGFWYLLLVLIAIIVLLFNRLENSRLGRAWAAIREDEVAAQATGINTRNVKLLAFAIGASTSGVAGVFFASQVGSFTPENFVLNNSILVVAYVVFGGMGSLPGAMAGAAVLTWLPEFLKDQVPAEDRQMWIGALILVMMIFRPAGLIPARRRKAELSGLDRPSSAEATAVPAGEGM
ncbi:branched-chain amino acid ABC transporter permease [Marmoricola sp. URHB0036]|uniref:branched-chain amino acid ABC transporter permease n=1 Tax=Marmoricola sp. URHB0036 TaxID=1298863 RepID=UPI000415C6F8|nr:branched-chain amino acid ABC transporter permease [Marmoricola sp. URHB0036]